MPEMPQAAHQEPGRVFAERLKTAMARKGWTLSETARQASRVLGPDAKFGRAHVWHYLNAGTVPRARHLQALSESLDVEPAHLLGTPDPGPLGTAMSDRRPDRLPERPGTRGLTVEEVGVGTVRLEVRQRVPLATALEVLRLLQNRPQTNPDEDASRG